MERRGITPIISVVLMVLLLVAIFGGLYIWMKKTQGDVQKGISKTTSEQTKNIQESQTKRLSINAVYNDTSNTPYGGIIINFLHEGSEPIRYTELNSMVVKIDGIPVSTNAGSISADLSPKGTLTVNINDANWNWKRMQDGNVHTIEVSYGSGLKTTYTCGPLGLTDSSCG